MNETINLLPAVLIRETTKYVNEYIINRSKFFGDKITNEFKFQILSYKQI